MSESENIESYPPLFRQPENPVEPDDNPPVMSDPIPVIDLKCMKLEHVHEACKKWGIFRLVNHGIPTTLLKQLKEHAKNEIFCLPFESKQTLFGAPVSYFWGTPVLTPSGTALSPNTRWRVEGFQFPLAQLPPAHTENLPNVVAFRILLEEYGEHLTRLSSTLYKAMANNLKLDQEGYNYLSESTEILRMYRYIPSPSTSHAFGMEEHTDSSILTILNQDRVGGLQVLKDEKWIHVEPDPDTLVINVGDMLQALSDDEYVSVKHRVMVNQSEERNSIGYFMFPAEDRMIQSSKYKPFNYGDFRAQVQQDVKTIGFKIGLDKFKLY